VIEFFLSKFWAVICGLLLLGAVTASIDGLTDASEKESQEAVFRAFVEEMNSFTRLDGMSNLVIAASDIVRSDDDHITFGNGTSWLCRDDGNTVLCLDEMISVVDANGEPIGGGSIDAHRADHILLTKDDLSGTCTLKVQEANVSTTFFTDSTNMSQSFSSL